MFETQVAQGRANLDVAKADTERLRVALDDAVTQLVRSEDLAEEQLISVIELEAAQVTVRSAEAQLKSSEAAIIQAEASLNQNELNLEHTVLRAPNRRHRDLALGRCLTDRRREPSGARIVRNRGRPVKDARYCQY